jgi:hypothetical protein
VPALVSTGHTAAAKLPHARILLKAEVRANMPHWTVAATAKALDTTVSIVHRMRRALVKWGLEATFSRKRPTGRQYYKWDETQEAQLIAVACNAPPEGRTQ